MRQQPGAAFLEMPEQIVLFRNDNLQPLGVVSKKYQVVQPREVLEFFRDGLVRTMALTGRTRIADIDRGLVRWRESPAR